MNSSQPTRNAPVWVTAALTLLAVALLVAAALYLADTAAKLPAFFPGHQAGSNHHHTKHGIAALAVAVAALAGAWLSSGRKLNAE